MFDLHILDWFGFEGRELFVFLFTLCSPASSDSEARPRRSALQTQLDSTQLNPTQLASPYRQLLISLLPLHSLPLEQKSDQGNLGIHLHRAYFILRSPRHSRLPQPHIYDLLLINTTCPRHFIPFLFLFSSHQLRNPIRSNRITTTISTLHPHLA